MSAGGGAPQRRVPRLLFAVVRPLRQFFRTQAAGGVVLLAATLFALVWANSRFAESYEHLLHTPFSVGVGSQQVSWPLHHVINDALMALFFLVAGMEIKRELVSGELASVRRAALPAVAALGGMLVPAGIYALFNHGGPGSAGWGIPMATDIAFAVGCLALVRKRVPSSLVVFLLALAIFDDLGAIVVIAVFYGGAIDAAALGQAGVVTAALLVLARVGVRTLWPYLVLGALLWWLVLRSGIHATIAGVVLGLALPARPARPALDVLGDLEQGVARLRSLARREGRDAGAIAAIERHLEAMQSPLDRMTHGLHAVVAFGIIPVFALANAGVAVRGSLWGALTSPVGLGVTLGLAVGKAAGVFGAASLAEFTGLAPRPSGATRSQLFGTSVLAGIGFTMSIFVTGLAFPGVAELEDAAKVAIFAASALCAVVGVLLLRFAGGALPASADEAGDDDVEVRVGLPSFAEGFSLARWSPPESARGQPLRDLALPATRGVWVVGVYPGDGRALEPAGADTLLQDGIDALVVGPREAVERLLAGAEPPEANEPRSEARRSEPPAPPESPESSSESVVA